MHWRLGPLLSVSGMRWRLQEAVSSGRSFQHWVCALQGTGGILLSLLPLAHFSAMKKVVLPPQHICCHSPSPECVTEPQSDGAGHGWDCDYGACDLVSKTPSHNKPLYTGHSIFVMVTESQLYKQSLKERKPERGGKEGRGRETAVFLRVLATEKE